MPAISDSIERSSLAAEEIERSTLYLNRFVNRGTFNSM